MLNRLDEVKRLNIRTEISIIENKISRIQYFVHNRYEGEKLDEVLAKLVELNDKIKWVEE